MPEKYLYKDKVMQRKEVEDAAKQSGMDIDTYYQKAGLRLLQVQQVAFMTAMFIMKITK